MRFYGDQSLKRKVKTMRLKIDIRPFAFLFLTFFVMGFCVTVWAGLEETLPTGEFVELLFQDLGKISGGGMTAMGIAALITQSVMRFFRTNLASFAGKWRLVIVYALSLVSGVLALMTSGLGFLPALIHANSLAAFQVLAHQIWKQFTEKKKVEEKK